MCVVWWWCSLALVCVVAAGSAGAERSSTIGAREGRSPLGPSLRIERVEILPGPVVRLALSGPAAEPRVQRLPARDALPERIYIDVRDAVLGPAVPRLVEGAGPVLRLRAGQFGRTTARVVIDLARAVPFHVEVAGETVSVALDAATDAGGRERRPGREGGAADATVVEASAFVGPPAPPSAPAPDGPPASREAGAGETAPPGVEIATVRGMPFLWPALAAPEYQDAGAEPFRRRIAAWQGAEPPPETALAAPASPAAFYLAADALLLDAAHGRGDLVAVAAAYRRALLEAPDFADAARAQFMLGHVNLALAFAPEAGAAFGDVERRFPEDPLVPHARLGQAAALRLRGRADEARRLLGGLLAHPDADVRCRARLETVALERAAGRPALAAETFRAVARDCPEMVAGHGRLAEYAETLVEAGDRAGARALVLAPRAARAADEEARLQLVAGMLLLDEGNVYRAREAYEEAIRLQRGRPLGIEAEMRLTLLDAADRPERATAALTALAHRRETPRALGAAILGEAAETNARAGRFEEALALLDEAAALGPHGRVQADGRRPEMFGRWLATLGAEDDATALATVYAAHATDIRAVARVEDRLVIAGALRRLGLHGAAAELLRRPAAASPEAAVELADHALAAGEIETARTVVERVAASRLPEPLVARVHRTAARAALVAGDVETAAGEAAAVDDAGLRAEVARALLDLPGGAARARRLLEPVVASPSPPVAALLAAGAAAAAEGAWAEAVGAYERALGRAETAAERIEASAGLARAAHANGDQVRMAAALTRLGETGDPLLRRAAAAVGRAAALGADDAR